MEKLSKMCELRNCSIHKLSYKVSKEYSDNSYYVLQFFLN